MAPKKLSEHIDKSFIRRRLVDRGMSLLLIVAEFIAILPLFSILAYIFVQGLEAINWDFFTQLPKPVGEPGGGLANALLGTGLLVALASLLGIPWGIGVGLYLSEFGFTSWAKVIRFSTELLSSVPSIVIGLYVYTLIVLPMQHFSTLAGASALAIIMIPTVARTTEELLRMVPSHVREAGLALGLSRWRVILFIILKGSRKGIMTSVMLAIARISGETAPLIFTAFNNQFWNVSLREPISSLPMQIYTYAVSPFDDWRRQAWAGALVLVLFVFAISGLTRLALSNKG